MCLQTCRDSSLTLKEAWKKHLCFLLQYNLQERVFEAYSHVNHAQVMLLLLSANKSESDNSEISHELLQTGNEFCLNPWFYCFES